MCQCSKCMGYQKRPIRFYSTVLARQYACSRKVFVFKDVSHTDFGEVEVKLKEEFRETPRA